MPPLRVYVMETPATIEARGIEWAFHFAQQYQDRSWNVIPLTGKQAAILWKEYQTRRATLGQIGVWFGHRSQHNVGIVTGAISDLTVVDCDSRDEAVWWWQNRPRTPLMVRTGKGIHFYYRYSEIGNKAGVLGRKIDIRGDGGYVAAPPSIHPDTGQPYEWIDIDPEEFHLNEVPAFDDQWIKDGRWIKPANEAQPVIRNARAYISRIFAISGKKGHNATFRAACKLRDAGLNPEEALAELVLWNQTNAKPPWSVQELLHKVRDAFSVAVGGTS